MLDKLIFLLPEDTPLCTADFLARLINIGIYNFTSNVKGVIYLLKKTNSLKDVEGIDKGLDEFVKEFIEIEDLRKEYHQGNCNRKELGEEMSSEKGIKTGFK